MKLGSSFVVRDLPPLDANLPDPAHQTHDNQAWVIFVVTVVCLTLVTPVVAARIYTRRVLLNCLWFDDYLTIVSWALLFTHGVLTCWQTRYGIGYHLWDVLATTGLVTFMKQIFIDSLLYNVAILFIKLMFFFQYYRIIERTPKWRYIYIAFGLLTAGWTVSMIFTLLFTCVPIAHTWDNSIPAKCIDLDPGTQLRMAAIGNIITDAIILLLPVPVVWTLNLKKDQKIALFAIFGVGLFTCILSSFRVMSIFQPTDISYDNVALASWSTAEMSSGILCASVPTLRPLLFKVFPSLDPSKKTSAYIYDAAGRPKASTRGSQSGLHSSLRKTIDIDEYPLTKLDSGFSRPYLVKVGSDSGLE